MLSIRPSPGWLPLFLLTLLNGKYGCVCVFLCVYMCVCYMCSFRHSYVFGIRYSKNVSCRVVISVGMCWFMLSYVVCVNVSFSIGCVCVCCYR